MRTLKVGIVALYCLAPQVLLAVPVTYLGDTYDVTTTSVTTFVASQSLLESQVWWGSEAIAIAFSDLVNSQLGGPNAGPTAGGLFGPQFAHEVNFSLAQSLFSHAWDLSDNRTEEWASSATTKLWTFAVASKTTAVPEPATLLLLSAGLLSLGVAHRRRSLA